MGLDTVELVMEVEEQFEIEIPDDDFVELKTVWLLYQYILENRQKREIPYSADRATYVIKQYLKVRNDLMAWTRLPRKHFRPSTSLANVVGTRNRKQSWKLLGDYLKLELPRLDIPEGLAIVMLVGCLISGWAGLCFFVEHPAVGQFSPFWMSFFGSGLLLINILIFIKIAAQLSFAFPQQCSTVGDLVRLTKVPDEYGVRLENVDASEETVFLRLQKIIAETGDVPIENVIFEARFIQDLKFD